MLTNSQLEAYDRDGFVVLEKLLGQSDIGGVIAEYEQVIDERAGS